MSLDTATIIRVGLAAMDRECVMVAECHDGTEFMGELTTVDCERGYLLMDNGRGEFGLALGDIKDVWCSD